MPVKKAVAGRIANPFPKDDPAYEIAGLLVTSGPHSFEDMAVVYGGPVSPRMLGRVIRELEANGIRFIKSRNAEWGVYYELDRSGKADSLGKYDGYDAGVKEKAPVKRTANKASKARKVAKATKSGPGRSNAPQARTAGSRGTPKKNAVAIMRQRSRVGAAATSKHPAKRVIRIKK